MMMAPPMPPMIAITAFTTLMPMSTSSLKWDNTLALAGVTVMITPAPGGFQLPVFGKLASMLLSVVSRSCWPDSHLTGSVQKVPAPTLAGIESDPSKRAAVAL